MATSSSDRIRAPRLWKHKRAINLSKWSMGWIIFMFPIFSEILLSLITQNVFWDDVWFFVFAVSHMEVCTEWCICWFIKWNEPTQFGLGVGHKRHSFIYCLHLCMGNLPYIINKCTIKSISLALSSNKVCHFHTVSHFLANTMKWLCIEK